MAFPRRLLHVGEKVFCDQRPHPIRLVFPIGVASVVLASIAFVFVVWRTAPAWFGILLGVAFVGDVVYVTSRVLAWRARGFVVTSHRVIYRSGIWRRAGREIPIDSVQQVTFRQNLFGRLIRHGTLYLSSAGEPDEQLVPDVRDPERVQTEIHAAIEASVRRRYGVPRDEGAEEVPESLERSDPAEELSRLEILHRRGVITAAELERARTELGGESSG